MILNNYRFEQFKHKNPILLQQCASGEQKSLTDNYVEISYRFSFCLTARSEWRQSSSGLRRGGVRDGRTGRGGADRDGPDAGGRTGGPSVALYPRHLREKHPGCAHRCPGYGEWTAHTKHQHGSLENKALCLFSILSFKINRSESEPTRLIN